MNDKHAEMAKGFRLAAEILESGAIHYECYDHLRGWERSVVSRADLADHVKYGREFRAIPWKLSDELPGFRKLREGERWHREDFTRDMLPDGWRPLLMGEEQQKGDQYYFSGDGTWNDCIFFGTRTGRDESAPHRRTRRPIPEPAPEPEWVQLGPEDVPPFSVIRKIGELETWHWRLISYVNGLGMTCADRGYPWREVADTHEINRSIPLTGKWDPLAWETCRKRKA